MEQLVKITQEIAKIQREIDLLKMQKEQSEQRLLIIDRDRASKKESVTREEEQVFNRAQQAREAQIKDICSSMKQRVEDLIDTFPDLKTKEFAGKYEVKAVEEALADAFGDDLVVSFVPLRYRAIEEEKYAYRAYTRAETRSSSLKYSGVVSWVYNTLNDALLENAVGRRIPVAMGVLAILFVVSPFAFVAVLSSIGITSLVQGIRARSALNDLYHVKDFLNNAYDTDIFQEDKSSIMADVESHLEETQEEYLQIVRQNKFEMNPSVLRDIDEEFNRLAESLKAKVAVTDQQIQELMNRQERFALEHEDLKNKIAEQSARFKEKAFTEIDWQYKWIERVVYDVNLESGSISTCNLSQCNSIYLAKNLNHLKSFWQLCIYQAMLRMHPMYASQVVLDYKYGGSNLLPFTRVGSSILHLAYDKETIDKKLDSIKSDIRSRSGTILTTCANLDEFNEIMKSYDSYGESYVIVHLFGLKAIPETLQDMMRNGPRVGYFFKLYFTNAEAEQIVDDVPYDDVTEFVDIGEKVMTRSSVWFKRELNSDS